MKLYHEIEANQSKQDTLFIHGNLASTKWWHPTVQEWKKLGAIGNGRLILADWRGCGKNPEWPIDQQFTLQDLAEDYLELLESKNSNEVALVGHSLGGLIALQMMLLKPNLFSRALLLDPVGAKGVVFDDSMYEAFRQMAANERLTQTVILSTIRGSENLDLDLKDELGADAFKAVRGIGSSVLEILKSVNISEELKTLTVPTLILHGSEDNVIPLNDSKELASIIPGAQLEVLKDQGHCFNLENPKMFTRRLRDWLS